MENTKGRESHHQFGSDCSANTNITRQLMNVIKICPSSNHDSHSPSINHYTSPWGKERREDSKIKEGKREERKGERWRKEGAIEKRKYKRREKTRGGEFDDNYHTSTNRILC